MAEDPSKLRQAYAIASTHVCLKKVLAVIKWLLEHVPSYMFTLSTVLICMLHPQMEKIIALPYREHIWKVIWKKRTLFVPSKEATLLFAYPRPFQRWLKIRRGDAVFEGGSAIGEDTVRIAEIVGPQGRVFAVEPDPENYRFLKVNVRDFGNVETINKGVWNCRSLLHFQRGGTLGGHLSSNALPRVCETIEVSVDTIDNITHNQKVDVIKLNVEGAEIEALEGASRTLEHAREILVSAHHIRNGKYTVAKIMNILKSRGFYVRLVHGLLAHHYVQAKKVFTKK